VEILPLVPHLVPSTCWYSNLRSLLPRKDWDRIRRQVYNLADYHCRICGGQGKQHPVEAHEFWLYDDAAETQRLTDVMALCPMCHSVQHFGRVIPAHQDRVLKHMAKVNNWSMDDVRVMIEISFEQWAYRSRHSWRLDISSLSAWGFDLEDISKLQNKANKQRGFTNL